MAEIAGKPASISCAEFTNSLTELINSSRLPAFIIELAMRDVLHNVSAVAKRQLEQDVAEFNKLKDSPEKK